MSRASLRILIAVGVLAASAQCKRPRVSNAPTPAPGVAPAPVAGGAQLPPGHTIADVAARVTPSVVNVFSERTIAPQGASPYLADPFFRFFFGTPSVPTQRERSLGSGVIISADGVILTNNHVVDHADKVRVALKDGRELPAKIVGTDPQSDVAVLRVDAKDLPAIEVADSAKTRTGDLVLAIGDPFGLGQTVTFGIISAVGRANMGITDYEDFIQTDAAINPGNSGGALVDMNGRLVGINTAIVSRSGGYQGIGFAIPSNMAIEVEREILAHGKVTRGWLGVTIQQITPDLAKSLHLAMDHGVLVSDVTPGSPAATAGLERGDVITAIDGTPTNTSTQLRNIVALGGSGKRIHIELEHAGQHVARDVVLGEPPKTAAAPPTAAGGMLAGAAVEPLAPEVRRQLHVPDQIHGVLVAKVDPNSPAADVGLQPGDVIVEVNREATPDLDAFRKAARADQHGVLLLVYRDGATIYMSLQR